MKKTIPVLLSLLLSLGLFSCGSTSISGDNAVYTNPAGSVSIELPGKWTSTDKASDDTIDVIYSNDAAEVYIQCLSKGQLDYLAQNLDGYADYSTVNNLGDILMDAETADTEIAVPDYIINSRAQSFTLKNGDDAVKGFVVFMESSRCYYTCLAMAVDEVYNSSEDKLVESVLSIREIKDIPEETESEEN